MMIFFSFYWVIVAWGLMNTREEEDADQFAPVWLKNDAIRCLINIPVGTGRHLIITEQKVQR